MVTRPVLLLEVLRHPVQLAVQRVLVACAGHEVADLDVADARADLLDDPAQRVAQRRVGVELAGHLAVGGRDAIVGRLRASTWIKKCGSDGGPLDQLVRDLAEVVDTVEFDEVWNEIYDYADSDRAWIDTIWVGSTS